MIVNERFKCGRERLGLLFDSGRWRDDVHDRSGTVGLELANLLLQVTNGAGFLRKHVFHLTQVILETLKKLND